MCLSKLRSTNRTGCSLSHSTHLHRQLLWFGKIENAGILLCDSFPSRRHNPVFSIQWRRDAKVGWWATNEWWCIEIRPHKCPERYQKKKRKRRRNARLLNRSHIRHRHWPARYASLRGEKYLAVSSPTAPRARRIIMFQRPPFLRLELDRIRLQSPSWEIGKWCCPPPFSLSSPVFHPCRRSRTSGCRI